MITSIKPKVIKMKSKSHIGLWIVKTDKKKSKEFYSSKFTGFISGFISGSYIDKSDRILNISVTTAFSDKGKALDNLTFDCASYKSIRLLPDSIKCVILFNNGLVIGVYPEQRVINEQWTIGKNLINEIESYL